jgi:hypothetical protein
MKSREPVRHCEAIRARGFVLVELDVLELYSCDRVRRLDVHVMAKHRDELARLHFGKTLPNTLQEPVMHFAHHPVEPFLSHVDYLDSAEPFHPAGLDSLSLLDAHQLGTRL